MGDTFVRSDGFVEWRPDPRTEAELTRDGGYIISRGQLCTACLVGDWGLSLLRSAKTLCDDCMWLEAEVSRLAGVDGQSRAGRAVPGTGLVIGGIHDPDDLAWEPIRAARRVRDERLSEVFARAAEVGPALVGVGDGDGTVRVIDCDDVARFGLIPDAAEDRVARFAEWLRVLAPEDHAVRAAVLGDIADLAVALRKHQRDRRQARARTELDRAVREVAEGLASVGRAPRALGAAASRVVRERIGGAER